MVLLSTCSSRGSLFIIAPLVGEGIHEKGIYYRPFGGGNIYFIKLAKWEDISDLEIDRKNNQLKSFKLKKTRIYISHPGQYYNLEDITQIEYCLYE